MWLEGKEQEGASMCIGYKVTEVVGTSECPAGCDENFRFYSEALGGF